MPRWPWSKKKKPSVPRQNLPENYANRITGFGQNGPKRTWAQWLNRLGPWKKNTRKAPAQIKNYYALPPRNESKEKLAPGSRPALTRKRAKNIPEFNYANLNWLKGNVFGNHDAKTKCVLKS